MAKFEYTVGHVYSRELTKRSGSHSAQTDCNTPTGTAQSCRINEDMLQDRLEVYPVARLCVCAGRGGGVFVKERVCVCVWCVSVCVVCKCVTQHSLQWEVQRWAAPGESVGLVVL